MGPQTMSNIRTGIFAGNNQQYKDFLRTVPDQERAEYRLIETQQSLLGMRFDGFITIGTALESPNFDELYRFATTRLKPKAERYRG